MGGAGRVLVVVAGMGLSGALAYACQSFTGASDDEPRPTPEADAGAEAATGLPDTGSPDASALPCPGHPQALYCDDFEADDLDDRWSIQQLALGTAEIVDGASVGRSGKVLHFKATRPGGTYDTSLFLRRALGEVVPVRVAYDFRTNAWPIESGLSNVTVGVVVHGALFSWLSINTLSRGLAVLEYTGNTFYEDLAADVGLSAPVDRWEHYEVVVRPGTPMHAELWIGTPPVRIAQGDYDVKFSTDAGFSPTFIELGLTRSNAGPMPAIEVWYDNLVVSAP